MNEINSEFIMSSKKLEKLVSVAIVADKIQTENLIKLTQKILCNSFTEKQRKDTLDGTPKLLGTAIGLGIKKLLNNYTPGEYKKTISEIRQSNEIENNNLCSRLNRALKKIQTMNANELFHILKINKDRGIGTTINYILLQDGIPLSPYSG